ncbi:TetR/AcrR family transcriptional regulator C-terminal domain-containing protein [Plantactinospora sp. S1510]|uniref:TetR/AcrR family transcriptional regulator C-terminal domain-containing protein n=2 Tax=Plantactinospora alkalitolerans TaxID=2789879 RepID=A0ABS0HAE6_9ACTN|nr:TetR/AcrR family transcriptional regulator C-terminal domain-containing protein [Plantactinospora alkalitolerans]
MELLWGTQDPPRRGPKPKLSVQRIVRTAIEVADAEGLSGLSMRRVADELGVTAMSLYTYVPGKAELIDVMVDTVHADHPRPAGDQNGDGDGDADADADGTGWRTGLERLARENWARYLRHPWLLQVATSLPVLGPHLLAKYDRDLTAVDGLGLTEIEMDLVVSLLHDYVYGAVRSVIEAARAEQRTGMTGEQWWETYAPLLEQVFDADRYPTASRVGSVSGAEYGAPSDPARAFEFGLQRVLDGIETLVRTRAAEPLAGQT